MKPINLDDILKAASIGESYDWEFKSGLGGFPRSFWETYSAMANTEGGIIIFGGSQKDNTVKLDGLAHEQIQKYKKILWDNLNNRNKVSVCLLANSDVQVIDISGNQLLIIKVPRAKRGQRPVYLGPTPFSHTFRRLHEGDYCCTDDDVRRMLADADPLPADGRILQNFDLSDLDQASVTQYRQRFRSAKGDHPWLALEDRDFLEKLGGWRQDRQTGQEGLTVAGMLMFGKDQIIRDPNVAPCYFVDFREKLDPSTRWSDRVYPDGTWEANLFQFYQRVGSRLTAAVPVPFKLQDGVRRDETPAHEALREAFVNTLIHADYSAPGGIVLERYSDRMIFGNPGTLLVSLEQYHRGGVSECRNKALQQMFLMIGGGERAGSGVDKIRSGWLSQNWRTPWIETQFQPDRIRLTLPMLSLIPEETLQHLRDRLGSRLDSLSSAEVQALATAAIEGGVSNSRLQELLTDHPVDISRMLQKLCEDGLLASDNRRRWTTYVLAQEPRDQPLFLEIEKIKIAESLHKETGSPLQASSSSHLADNSSHLTVDSLHQADHSLHLPDKITQIGELTNQLQERVKSIAIKRKASAKEIREIILQLCRGQYLSVDSLAKLLNRNPAGLRNRYLSPMVTEGLLQLRFPDKPNRPDQAYTICEKN